jgi:hypothetical protein
MLNPTPLPTVATMPMSLIIWSMRPVEGPRAGTPQGAHATLPPRDVLALLGVLARNRRWREFSDSDGVTFTRRRAPWSRRRSN